MIDVRTSGLRWRTVMGAVVTVGAVVIVGLGGCGSVREQPTDAAAGDDAQADAAPTVDAAACVATTCSADVLTVCGAAGTVESVETCGLGCASNDRCTWLVPSNGLGAQLAAAAAADEVSLPAGSVVNTDTGTVQVNNQVIAVATATVAQAGGPMLRAFLARTWTIDDVRIEGSLPVAFVAIGDVRIHGIIDASADRGVAAPGSSACGAPGTGGEQTFGFWQRAVAADPVGTLTYAYNSHGAGGGGFGAAGAAGGAYTGTDPDTVGAPGGAANGTPGLVPLRGGCRGGGSTSTPIPAGPGGHGGGAVQIVSAAGELRITGTSPVLAGVHVGGGGGLGCELDGRAEVADPHVPCRNGGGGSGGGILLEAPSVTFDAASALLAAGGGGGGQGICGLARHGQDAPASAATSGGGICPADGWGQRGIGGAGGSATPATLGSDLGYRQSGSGGGGVGRIRINTANGAYAGEATVVVRGALTTGTVQPQP